ncbi:nucleotidyltransferase domain-containing protein [Luteimicrobium subarcticum]|uniref:Nucleotidyltransferase-like protein n=1 Tax=Luteimicrobium subarcticum TaxID=620910 RepID=A0A2M8WRV6_9MICO|nr:nucleotidyltransferase domain-containing protein [Luteimicrobium subarcticum]PJI93648.1 nucleotidyltransferase-like protein [Luteimicrobium subarcticum]
MDLTHPIATVIPSLDGRVLAVLSRTTRPMAGRQIARLLPDASLRGVQLALERLERQGLVLAEPFAHAVMFSANRRHLLWPAIERLVEAAASTPTQLRRLVQHTVQSFDPELAPRLSIALYGSAARQAATPDSDIDVLIVEPAPASARVDDLVAHLAEEVRLATGNDCNVYLTTRERLDEMVRERDPIIASWLEDAEMVTGPDVRPHLEGSPWRA